MKIFQTILPKIIRYYKKKDSTKKTSENNKNYRRITARGLQNLVIASFLPEYWEKDVRKRIKGAQKSTNLDPSFDVDAYYNKYWGEIVANHEISYERSKLELDRIYKEVSKSLDKILKKI